MTICDRATVLRQNLDALATELSEVEKLRDRVLKAEQRRLDAALQRKRSGGKRLVAGPWSVDVISTTN